MSEFPERVTTDRLVLRRLEPRDRADYVEVHSDPATNRHHPVPTAWTPEAVEEGFGDRLADWERDGCGYWVVATVAEPERLIGFTGVRRMTVAGRPVLNLYYRYRPESWGHGYAVEGARAAIQAAREAYPDLPVVAKTTPSNVASQRTALAAGLTRIEELDQAQDGWTDIYFALNWSS